MPQYPEAVKVNAVFFDLFETLITEKSRPDFSTRPPLHERLGCTSDQIVEWWTENEASCMIGGDDGDISRFHRLCREVSSPLTGEEIQALADEQEAWKRTVLGAVDPRLLQLLNSLRRSGITVGIISNAMASEFRAWQSSPLRNSVDDAVFSCDVGLMKPQAEIYTLALDRLDVVPANALFVGDGGHDELAGAAAIGMTVVQAAWYLSRQLEWPDAPPPRLHSIDELETVLWSSLGRRHRG